MQKEFTKLNSRGKRNKVSFFNGIISISLFGVLALPVTSLAFTLPTAPTGQAGYDSYLLFTEHVGQTLAQGITAGVENTAQLYQSAWNELVSQGGTFKVPPLLASTHNFISSYLSFGNDMGEALADNIIRYVSLSNSVGDALAQGINNGVNNSIELYATSFAKTKQFVQKTPNLKLAINTDGVASITDIWNSTTNYFSNLFKTTPPSTQPSTTKPQTSPTKPTTVPPALKPIVTPTPEPKPTPSPPSNPITKTPILPPQQLVVEHTVERVLSGLTSADLESRIEQLRNELVGKIGSVSAQSQTYYVGNTNAIALTNKIDQLTNTTITSPSITGGSITNTNISGGSISGSTISGAISVSSGTFSGNLDVQGTATSTFAGDSNFDLGTLYIDSLNNRVGVGTTSPSDTFALNGPAYFAQVSAPGVTTNRLYNENGNLTWNGSVIGGSVGSWSLSGGDVYRPSGNVGIGTTSPYAALSVAGSTGVVANMFTATSTTATSLFSGITTFSGQMNLPGGGNFFTNGNWNSNGANISNVTSILGLNAGGTNLTLGTNNSTGNLILEAGTQTEHARLTAAGNLGIGTTSPYAKLSVVGEVVAANFTATSTTATSTFAGGAVFATGGGNVGIGTSTPKALFEIFKTSNAPTTFIRLETNSAANGASAAIDFSNSTSANNVVGGRIENIRIDGSTGAFAMSTRIGTVLTEGFRLVNGNIGIGTTSPYAKLSVVGEVVASNFTATSTTATSAFAGAVTVGNITVNGGISGLNSGANGIVLSISGASLFSRANNTEVQLVPDSFWQTLTAYTNGSERLRITNAGNIGIGTTSPYAKLSVVGETVSSYFTATSTTATSTFNGGLSVTSKTAAATLSPSLQPADGSGLLRENFLAIGEGAYINNLGYTAADKVTYGITGNNTVIGAGSGISGATNYQDSNTIVGGNSKTTGAVRAATVVGAANTVSGGSSVTIGVSLTNSASNSILIGTSGGTSGGASAAIGVNASAQHLDSVAMGWGTATSNAYDFVYGSRSTAGANPSFTLQGTTNQYNGDNMFRIRTVWIDSALATKKARTTFNVFDYNAEREFMRADSTGSGVTTQFLGGNVGIGTTTPYAALSVNAVSGNYNNTIFSVASSTAAFATTTLFNILATGNVGIATTSPWRTLSVTGTVGFDGLTTSVTGNAVCITTNKEITNAGAASCVPSSIRFKENINELPLGTALDELRKMAVKTFTYKKEYQMDTQEHIGLIAEDLETIDPRLVVYNTTDGKPWSIHFEELTGLLVQATQAFDTRISALEANAGIIKDITGKWSIDASGKLVVGEVEADKVTTKTLCIDDVCIGKEALRALIEKSGATTQSASVINNSQPTQEPTSPTTTPDSTSTIPLEPTVSETNPAGNGAGNTEPSLLDTVSTTTVVSQ